MRGIRAFLIGVIIVGIFAFVMSGCSVIDRADDNPLLVRIAVTQGVLRYIEAGESAADVTERKQNVVAVMRQTLLLIDDGDNVDAAIVFSYFVSAINLDDMPLSDRLLATETLLLVQGALNDRIQSGELPADTLLTLRGVVQTAIDAANYL